MKTTVHGKRYKNFKSGIAFSLSLTISLKQRYEKQHSFVFAFLVGWLYLNIFNGSHWYLKPDNTPLMLHSNMRTG